MSRSSPIDIAAASGRLRVWPIAVVTGLLIGVTGWLVRDSDRALAELHIPAVGESPGVPAGGATILAPAPAIRALVRTASEPGEAADLAAPVNPTASRLSKARRLPRPFRARNDRQGWPGARSVPDQVRLALNDADPAVRLNAIGELEARADALAGEMLAQVLSDPDVRVRRIAVDALASMPVEAAAAPLQQALFDEDRSVRLLAVDALADVGGEWFLDAMLIALHDRHADVRLAVVENLSDFDDPRARNLLQLALGDGDPAIRAVAAEYLGDVVASSGRDR